MNRLVVNPDTPQSWEIQLKPGLNFLGSGIHNDFQISDDSVSDPHCQILIENNAVVIEDLQSVNGTFVDGVQIEKSILKNGQRLALGKVQMRFEAEPSSIPTIPRPRMRLELQKSVESTVPARGSSPVLSEAAADTPLPGRENFADEILCKNHPKAKGRHHCPQCQETFCDFCVDRKSPRGRLEIFCRNCGSACDRVATAETETDQPRLGAQLAGAFAYPFRGDGPILLASGTVFFFVIDLVARHAAVFGLLLMLAAAGYLISYYRRILLASAAGEDRLPDWPDFTDFGDLASPVLQFTGTVVFSFGPAILVTIFAPDTASWTPWALALTLLLGCVYFPMAFTAVAMTDSLSALNPVAILLSIGKIPWAYLLTIVVLAAIFAVSWAGTELLPRFLPIPILPGLLEKFIGIYLATVEMRILGLLYLNKKNQLGWF